MSRFITIEELPQYAPGKLLLDSAAVGRPDFRMRVFRYAKSDICVPPSENFLIVVYRQGETSMNRRVTGAWKQENVGHGVTTLLTRAEPSLWRWGDDIEVSHFYISPAFMQKTASEAFDRDIDAVELHDLLGVNDPVLNWLSEQMALEVARGGPGGRLCYDCDVASGERPHITKIRHAAVQGALRAGAFQARACPADRGICRSEHFQKHHARRIGDDMQLHADSVRAKIPRPLWNAAARLCVETEGRKSVLASAQRQFGAQGDRAPLRICRPESSEQGISPAPQLHSGGVSQGGVWELTEVLSGVRRC